MLKNFEAAEKDIKLALYYSPAHPKYLQWLALIEEGLNKNRTGDNSQSSEQNPPLGQENLTPVPTE